MKFALYFGNRGFFPGELIAEARKELMDVLDSCGYAYIAMEENATKFGAVETAADGEKYAAFLKENEGEFDGVILCLPNFGDENGAVAALRRANVPILIQAYPDEIGKMDFASRRDAYCGKFSIMDVFYQCGIQYTAYKPHVIHPADPRFTQQLHDFAALCRTVKAMRSFKVGAIGARTTAFKTVRYDELTLERYGITVEALDLSDLFIRIKNMSDASRLEKKVAGLKAYSNFGKVPADKIEILAKMSLAIDDIIAQYRLDCIALRCWNELQMEYGIAPCVLLSELNDRGIAAACELDICNAIPMYALAQASGNAATCLDWNNNYGGDENKCILFHCGPVPQSLMKGKGEVTSHKMFDKSYGAGCGVGTNEGRIDAFPFTFASAKTENGKLYTYVGRGEFTKDEIEKEFFGCGGVARIDDLQNILYYIGKNGYRHHVGLTKGDVFAAITEAFENYLGYEIKKF